MAGTRHRSRVSFGHQSDWSKSFCCRSQFILDRPLIHLTCDWIQFLRERKRERESLFICLFVFQFLAILNVEIECQIKFARHFIPLHQILCLQRRRQLIVITILLLEFTVLKWPYQLWHFWLLLLLFMMIGVSSFVTQKASSILEERPFINLMKRNEEDVCQLVAETRLFEGALSLQMALTTDDQRSPLRVCCFDWRQSGCSIVVVVPVLSLVPFLFEYVPPITGRPLLVPLFMCPCVY